MFTHFTHKGRQTPYFVVYYEFNEDMTVKEKKKNETKKMIGEIAILLILMGLTFSVLLRDQDLGEVVESVFSVRKRLYGCIHILRRSVYSRHAAWTGT